MKRFLLVSSYDRPIKAQFNTATSDPLMQKYAGVMNQMQTPNQPFSGTGSQIYNNLAATGGQSTGFNSGRYVGIDTAAQAQPQSDKGKDNGGDVGQTAINEGLQVLDMGLGMAGDKIQEKALKKAGTDSFGNQVFNEDTTKAAKKDAGIQTLSGVGQLGAGIATMNPAMMIQGGANALKGILNVFKAKKEGKEQEKEYNEQLQNNMSRVGRQQDLASAKALYGKTGTKLSKKPNAKK